MISGEIFQRLEPLSKTDRLLPVGGGDEFKAPLLKDWPNKPGQSIEQLKRWRGLRSIGIAIDHLVCIDVDGITAVERLLTLGLLDPELINTWRIDRDNDPHRFKLIWRPTPEQLRLLPTEISGKDHTRPAVRGDWRRLAHCPICGRNENTVCQVHTDGETIRCFRGSTFFPPDLQPGERTGDWQYKRDQHVGWGTFAIFHRANLGSPLQRLRREHRD